MGNRKKKEKSTGEKIKDVDKTDKCEKKKNSQKQMTKYNKVN
jgi:hypothetical protein